MRTNQRIYEKHGGFLACAGVTGHIADIGPSDMDVDDFETRETPGGEIEVLAEDVEVAPGCYTDQWEDGDDWLTSYGLRLEDGRILSVSQRELKAASHPAAHAQMKLIL